MQGHATAAPKLVKVLVRADEGGGAGAGGICAAVTVPASATGDIERDVTAVTVTPSRARGPAAKRPRWGQGGGWGLTVALNSRERAGLWLARMLSKRRVVERSFHP